MSKHRHSNYIGLRLAPLLGLIISTGCSAPRCPRGYDQRGDTCYRIKDAGPDSAFGEDADGGGDVGDATLSVDDAQAEDSEAKLDADADPCATCAENSRCFRAGGDVMCVCQAGYLQTGGRCVPDVPCAALECDEHAACVGNGEDRNCKCLPGFQDDGEACKDINECALDNGGCAADAICTNTEGARTCACRAGFVDVRGDGSECKSSIANECASTNVCTPEYPCQDLEMLYTCRGQFAEAPPMDAPNYLRADVGATVTDLRTGLVWQRNVPVGGANCEEGSCTWEEAKAKCSAGGFGLRLPTRAELQSIVDYPRYVADGIFIDRDLFPNTPGWHFWTASSDLEDPAKAWSVRFDRGQTVSIDKTTRANYRCVR